MSIGKMKRGEKVLVVMISEPLQEEYDRMDAVGNEVKALVDELAHMKKLNIEVPEAKMHEGCRLSLMLEKMRADFWWNVNETYNLFLSPGVGIRDGYCIVELKKKPDPEEFLGKLHKFIEDSMKEMTGEDSEEE